MPHKTKRSFSDVLKHFCRKYIKKFSWRSKNLLSLREANNYSESFSKWGRKGENPEEMFWFDGKDIIRSNLLNGTFFLENKFAPQNKPNAAKLNFSGVLKHFRGNWQKKLLTVKKGAISESS